MASIDFLINRMRGASDRRMQGTKPVEWKGSQGDLAVVSPALIDRPIIGFGGLGN